jgi:hypothetical protein
MSKTWRKRLGIGAAVIGGVALGAAGKDQVKGFAQSAGDTIGGLVGQLAKGRSFDDFLPSAADVRTAVEDLAGKTRAGQAAQHDAMAQRVGGFFTSPMGIGLALVAVVGLLWIVKR